MDRHLADLRQAVEDLKAVAGHLHTPLDTTRVERALDAAEENLRGRRGVAENKPADKP